MSNTVNREEYLKAVQRIKEQKPGYIFLVSKRHDCLKWLCDFLSSESSHISLLLDNNHFSYLYPVIDKAISEHKNMDLILKSDTFKKENLEKIAHLGQSLPIYITDSEIPCLMMFDHCSILTETEENGFVCCANAHDGGRQSYQLNQRKKVFHLLKEHCPRLSKRAICHYQKGIIQDNTEHERT